MGVLTEKQLEQVQDAMGQSPAALSLGGADVTPVSLPNPRPASGILCSAARGLTYDDLLEKVAKHRMENPLPVSPVVMGFLPFDDGQITPRYLLNAQDLLVMRLGIVSKTVPAAAIRRMMKEREQAYQENFGTQMPATQSQQLRGDCITELLSNAHASERDSLIFYQPSSGLMFVSEQGLTPAQAVVQTLNSFLPGMQARFLRPPAMVGDLIRGWFTENDFPEAVRPGRGLKMTTSREATVSFRNAEMGSPEVLAHFDLGSQVQELDLVITTDQGDATLSFNTAGMVRRIRIESRVNTEGLDGLSRLLREMSGFSGILFPALRCLYMAIAPGSSQ